MKNLWLSNTQNDLADETNEVISAFEAQLDYFGKGEDELRIAIIQIGAQSALLANAQLRD